MAQPGTDQGFSTASCNSHHALSPGGVHPPTSPYPTQSQMMTKCIISGERVVLLLLEGKRTIKTQLHDACLSVCQVWLVIIFARDLFCVFHESRTIHENKTIRTQHAITNHMLRLIYLALQTSSYHTNVISSSIN